MGVAGAGEPRRKPSFINSGHAFTAASRTGKTGMFSDLYALGSGFWEAVGGGPGNYAALNDEINKSIAAFSDANGQQQTDLQLKIASGKYPGLTKQSAANAWILATMQAQAERDRLYASTIAGQSDPISAYNASRSVVSPKNFDIAAKTQKYYEENLKKMGATDPTAPAETPAAPAETPAAPAAPAEVPPMPQSWIDDGNSAEAWSKASPALRQAYQ